ncbi:MAG: hypothetical protein HRT90_04525, partial [Candidatus Margulisbacteria bacterium]|nr:hypothetical protein [Candidatus Margulisiibacteriota bacterium]
MFQTFIEAIGRECDDAELDEKWDFKLTKPRKTLKAPISFLPGIKYVRPSLEIGNDSDSASFTPEGLHPEDDGSTAFIESDDERDDDANSLREDSYSVAHDGDADLAEIPGGEDSARATANEYRDERYGNKTVFARYKNDKKVGYVFWVDNNNGETGFTKYNSKGKKHRADVIFHEDGRRKVTYRSKRPRKNNSRPDYSKASIAISGIIKSRKFRDNALLSTLQTRLDEAYAKSLIRSTESEFGPASVANDASFPLKTERSQVDAHSSDEDEPIALTLHHEENEPVEEARSREAAGSVAPEYDPSVSAPPTEDPHLVESDAEAHSDGDVDHDTLEFETDGIGDVRRDSVELERGAWVESEDASRKIIFEELQEHKEQDERGPRQPESEFAFENTSPLGHGRRALYKKRERNAMNKFLHVVPGTIRNLLKNVSLFRDIRNKYKNNIDGSTKIEYAIDPNWERIADVESLAPFNFANTSESQANGHVTETHYHRDGTRTVYDGVYKDGEFIGLVKKSKHGLKDSISDKDVEPSVEYVTYTAVIGSRRESFTNPTKSRNIELHNVAVSDADREFRGERVLNYTHPKYTREQLSAHSSLAVGGKDKHTVATTRQYEIFEINGKQVLRIGETATFDDKPHYHGYVMDFTEDGYKVYRYIHNKKQPNFLQFRRNFPPTFMSADTGKSVNVSPMAASEFINKSNEIIDEISHHHQSKVTQFVRKLPYPVAKLEVAQERVHDKLPPKPPTKLSVFTSEVRVEVAGEGAGEVKWKVKGSFTYSGEVIYEEH